MTDNGSPAQNDFETITVIVANTGTGLISDGFEATGNAWDDNWDGNGNTNWYQSTTQFHSGTYSARSNNWNEGDLISDNLDTSGNPATIIVSFWFYHTNLNTDTDLRLGLRDNRQVIGITHPWAILALTMFGITTQLH